MTFLFHCIVSLDGIDHSGLQSIIMALALLGVTRYFLHVETLPPRCEFRGRGHTTQTQRGLVVCLAKLGRYLIFAEYVKQPTRPA